ncbi:MAG: HD-like signal output (HDOD) protein [Planctomycetota bacterium]|jgi:HD-like signal output (HDOD) protein
MNRALALASPMFNKRSKRKPMRQAAELAPFPGVALRVMQLATEADTGPTDLIGAMRADAAISGRILRLANSSLYGFRQRIDTLSAAGMALGKTRLVEVTLASVVSLYHAPRGYLDGRVSHLLWRRSLATALCAQGLAAEHGVDPSRTFFAGLFLPIGLLRFHQVYPPHVVERVRVAYASGLSGPQAERQVFGLDHIQEGARLVRDWELPAWISYSMGESRATQPIDLVGSCLRKADLVACSMLHRDGELAEEDRWSVDMPALEGMLESGSAEDLMADLRERTKAFDAAA